jgi:hypothetical protein
MGTTTTSPANKEATPPTPASASPAATDATKGSPPKEAEAKPGPFLMLFVPHPIDNNLRGFTITDQALISQVVNSVKDTVPDSVFIGGLQGDKGKTDKEEMGKLFAPAAAPAAAGAGSAAAAPATDPKASAPAPAAKDAKADQGTVAPAAPAAAKPADQPKPEAAKPADATPAPAPAPAKS